MDPGKLNKIKTFCAVNQTPGGASGMGVCANYLKQKNSETPIRGSYCFWSVKHTVNSRTGVHSKITAKQPGVAARSNKRSSKETQ